MIFWNVTAKYAKQDKNDKAFELSMGELMHFFNIVLLSGYHSLPSEQHFWLNQPDFGVPIVAKAMSSKRFLKIKGMFHLVDNKKLLLKLEKYLRLLHYTVASMAVLSDMTYFIVR